jgi:hypothetical protein
MKKNSFFQLPMLSCKVSRAYKLFSPKVIKKPNNKKLFFQGSNPNIIKKPNNNKNAFQLPMLVFRILASLSQKND